MKNDTFYGNCYAYYKTINNERICNFKGLIAAFLEF